MMKKILLFLTLVVIIIILIFFFIIDKILISKIISNIENDLNISINIKESHKFEIIPNISFLIKFDLEKKNQNLFIEEADLSLIKNYNNNPAQLIFKSENIKINNIIIENLIAQGEINKYNLKYFTNNNYSENLISKFKIYPEGRIYYYLNAEDKNSLKIINLIITKLNFPKIYKRLSDLAFSILTEKFYFTSKIIIEDELILFDYIEIQKDHFHIISEGKLNFLNNILDLNIIIKDKDEEIALIDISGNLNNPNIKLLSNDKTINLNFFMNDISQLFKDDFENILNYIINN